MKQTHHIGYVQTPSVKNLSNVKNALVENGLVPLTTPNEMLPDAIEKGLKPLEFKDYGMIHEGKYRIRYFDIDGTILKIEYVENGGKLTPPKKTPNYDPDYLIFDEWNYDIENYIVERPTDVGAIYDTKEYTTFLFCKFTNKTTLKVTLQIKNQQSVDWGDGTIDTNTSHTYTNEGEYVIKIKGNSNNVVTVSSSILSGSQNNVEYALNKIYFNSNTLISQNVVQYSYDVKYISLPKTYKNNTVNCLLLRNTNIIHLNLPKGITTFLTENFYNCLFLKSISISNECIKHNSNGGTFKQCKNLKFITLPNGTTRAEVELLYGCNSLEEVYLPNSITELGNYSCSQCLSLKNIHLPVSLTMLRNYALSYCENLQELKLPVNVNYFWSFPLTGTNKLRNLFIESITPITSRNGENSLNNYVIIWVNDDIIEDLKVATGWSTYASQMKPLSWYPSLTDPNAE